MMRQGWLRATTWCALAWTINAASAQVANSIRYSNTTPAAPAGYVNVNWQNDNSTPIVNLSAYAPAWSAPPPCTQASGSGAAFACTTPAPIVLAAGICVSLFPTFNSSAGATLAVNGGSAWPIQNPDGSAATASSIMAGEPAILVTDGSSKWTIIGALTAASFSGSLAGDVTGTQGATSVVKINGASLPATKTIVGTNSSGQIVDATGATLSNNTTGNAATATTATSFSGSLAGDVTGTQGATSVVKVNGAAVPLSATSLKTNGSGQLVAATNYYISGCTAVTITSNAGTLAMGGYVDSCGTVALSHSSTTTLNVSGLVNGDYVEFILTQDSTGGNTLTLGTGCTWMQGTNAGFAAQTTPALTAAASGVNILSAKYDGTNCWYNVR